ncbi:hypothetical protein [Streptomyces bambusae]|uniref:Uncharacterized protein n=1 Tax=Streptomyces bambusae TaxID=1550616 RepID=A0ABS6Z7S6_9ACTN|nr:hypothetical protein [Streptomyces bambusae]MBW5483792.1 hypothetical protein [Streptomyces bambusae]
MYSQSYLASQGIAITWDNPDIRITTPEGAPISSTSLAPDTDYVIEGTIHNASFDPAIGVVARSYFRSWGIDFADRQPTELDGNGEPAERIVHIGAWGQTIATFKWHTPALAGHYCVTVECHHPADREPANNVGQENTDVVEARPGSSARITVPFFNRRARERDFRLNVDEYEIPKSHVELTLERMSGRSVHNRAQRDKNTARSIEQDALRGARIRLTDAHRRARLGEGYEVFGYAGRSRLAAEDGHGNFELEQDWVVTLPGHERGENGWRVVVSPGDTEMIDVVVDVPERSIPEDRKVLNLTARDRFGTVVGGVTVILKVVANHAVP